MNDFRRYVISGDTEGMLAVVEAGAKWHPTTTSWAASGGHTETMLVAIKNGAEWHIGFLIQIRNLL